MLIFAAKGRSVPAPPLEAGPAAADSLLLSGTGEEVWLKGGELTLDPMYPAARRRLGREAVRPLRL